METKELKIQAPEGYEIDKENSTFERIVFKKKDDAPWNPERKKIDGVFIDSYGSITEYMGGPYDGRYDKNVFASTKEAVSSLAMAQISLLLKYDKRYGGVITDEEWNKVDIKKYYISRNIRGLFIDFYTQVFRYPAFHTKEQAELFLNEHENLIKQFYMMD